MRCPNCLEVMEAHVFDGQNVLHCPNCGTSFFEENGINRISLSSAKELIADKKGLFEPATQKLCPKDNTLFQEFRSDAVPPTVKLLKCATCQGILVYPEDLLIFKKAQNIKLEFYKTWQIPLPPLKHVLVLSFLAVVGASLFGGFFAFTNSTPQSTHAEDLVKNVSAVKSGRFVLITFKTQTALKSQIVIIDKTTGEQVVKIISSTPKTIHYLTTTDISPKDDVDYQIILSDESGKQFTTQATKLEIK